jgi:hypothetical protein
MSDRRPSRRSASAKRGLWLVGAVALFLCASWLTRGEEPEEKTTPISRGTVRLPTHMRHAERERQRQRMKPVSAIPAPSKESEPIPLRDPVMTAMPGPGDTKIAVVLEANAIRNSEIGELLLGCIDDEAQSWLEEAKGKGIDVVQDLDRVAVADKLVILSGNFAGAKLDQLGGESRRAVSYGKHQIWEPESYGEYLALWNGEMILAGENREEVEAALDRLDGKRPPSERPAIREGSAYGEVYGALSPELIEQLMGADELGIGKRIAEIADEIEIHADVTSDVGLVVEVHGADPKAMDDLSRAVGGAMAMARLSAGQENKKDLTELLDLARVMPDRSRFTVELALPRSFIESRLSHCKK